MVESRPLSGTRDGSQGSNGERVAQGYISLSVCIFHVLSSTVSVYIAGDTRNRAAIMRMNPTLTAGWTWFSVVSVLYNYEISSLSFFFLTFPDLILNCYQ